MSGVEEKDRHEKGPASSAEQILKPEWQRLEALFLSALDLEPGERTALLDRECGGDPGLRSEIQAMLEAHEGSELLLEGRLLAVEEAVSLVGKRLGPYRLVSLVGRGGMGEVYLGERDDEMYQRQVAVKLVQHGPRPSLLRRFSRERDILARLIHPHVATLYDGGVTEDGRPYLVMEYVDGVPITQYCDDRALGLRARIDLFLTVCEAVQFAHGALVVHRDLKPSNILVDVTGSVKLLDFGIAKLLEEEDDDPQHTSFLDRALTPEHAAPEQIRGEEPTTATDVYGLGVLLCELLVGERPLRFPTRSPAEIDRIAREVEALPPSRLLAAMDASARAGCAARRSTTEDRLARSLRGDLDAICRKALRKEADERYGSVAELVADIQAHLQSRPVRAVRGSRTYYARKLLRRHRTAISLSVVAFVVLGAFLVTALVQARRIEVERDRAQRQLERADLVLEKLVGLFESTQSPLGPGPDLMDVERFLRRGQETADALGDEPQAQARMYQVLADIFAVRGDLDRAVDLTARARDLSEDPIDRLRRSHQYARLRARRDGPQVGRPLLEASLQAQREALGPVHPDVVQAMLDLSNTMQDVEERRSLLMEASRQCDSMGPSQGMLRAAVLSARGAVEIESSRFDEAVALLGEADRILAPLPVTRSERISVRQNLSSAYARQGRWDLAEPMQREMVESRRQLNGEDSDLTARALESWAVTLANQGRHRESGEAFSLVLAIFERTLDPGHWRIANTARNVGQLLALQGRYEEALPHLERSLEINRGRRDGTDRRTYQRGQRAMIWLGLGQVERARNELAEVAAKLSDSEQGFSPSYAADGQIWLGIAELRAGRVSEARSCFRRALEIRSTLLQGDHPKLAEARLGLAVSEISPPGMDFQADLELYRAWGLSHPLMLELLHTHRP